MFSRSRGCWYFICEHTTSSSQHRCLSGSTHLDKWTKGRQEMKWSSLHLQLENISTLSPDYSKWIVWKCACAVLLHVKDICLRETWSLMHGPGKWKVVLCLSRGIALCQNKEIHSPEYTFESPDHFCTELSAIWLHLRHFRIQISSQAKCLLICYIMF